MPEFLRDPLWQFVGALLAFVAILVSLSLHRLQRNRKAFSYEVISRTLLLSIKEEIKGRLQILLDGNVVRDIHMIVIRVLNSGNVPIVPSDYDRTVKFAFGEKTQILSAEVIETNPENIEASVSIVSQKVVLTPVLLNVGDSITLKTLLSQFDGKIDVDGRIIGVKQLQKVKESLLPYVMPFFITAGLFLGGLLGSWIWTSGFWLSVALAIPLGLFVITLFDNLIDYYVRSHTNYAYEEYWYRSLLPSTAWLVLLALSIPSLSIGYLDNTARFMIFSAEAFFCLVLALFLCEKTFEYLHNVVYIYGCVMALGILASRVLLWDFVVQLAGSDPTYVIWGGIVLWAGFIGVQVHFAAKRFSEKLQMLRSWNLVQIGLTNLWGFSLAYSWVFRPLLALK